MQRKNSLIKQSHYMHRLITGHLLYVNNTLFHSVGKQMFINSTFNLFLIRAEQQYQAITHPILFQPDNSPHEGLVPSNLPFAVRAVCTDKPADKKLQTKKTLLPCHDLPTVFNHCTIFFCRWSTYRHEFLAVHFIFFSYLLRLLYLFE